MIPDTGKKKGIALKNCSRNLLSPTSVEEIHLFFQRKDHTNPEKLRGDQRERFRPIELLATQLSWATCT
jgi:hypothetical protein